MNPEKNEIVLRNSEQIKKSIIDFCSERSKVGFGSSRLKAMQDIYSYIDIEHMIGKDSEALKIIVQRIETRRVQDPTGIYDKDFEHLKSDFKAYYKALNNEYPRKGAQHTTQSIELAKSVYEDGIVMAREIRDTLNK